MFVRLQRSVVPLMTSRQMVTVSSPVEAVLPHLQSSEDREPLVLDLTLGSGSTSLQILERTKARVVGVDVDPHSSLTVARLTEEFKERFRGFQSTWSSLPGLLQAEDAQLGQCDLLIAELGPSSVQLGEGRGFNSSDPGLLDMRFSREGLLCYDLLRLGEVDHLNKIFKVYGGVIKSKAIVSEIVEKRYLMEDIKTAPHLYQILRDLHDRDVFWRDRGENAIADNIEKVFSACRMFINNEINELYFVIRMAEQVLRKNGLLVIEAKSEHERNLVLKYLLRDSGKMNNSEGQETFTNVWEQQKEQFLFRKLI